LEIGLERDDLIALLEDNPDPVELVAFLSRRYAPPVLQNTEGESLVMCDATLRVADPAGLTEALNDEYDRDAGCRRRAGVVRARSPTACSGSGHTPS